jgi:hypothetical protein
MKCIAHRLGLDHECRTPNDCDVSDRADTSNSVLGDSSDSDSVEIREDGEEKEEYATYKDDSTLRDQQSTGRKRAARWYPLDENKLCEWAHKKNCGGGRFPITGCLGNLQQARHHGPDKNTLNNEGGNVHRICHTCHNRWHILNDEGYVWGDVQIPHEPKPADPIEIKLNEEWWQDRKVVKAKD